jgi:predicted transcriptional regulator
MNDIENRPVALHALKIGAVCRQPSTYRLVHLDTPAIDVMTDFQIVSPAMIRPDATVSQATAMMVSRGVRFLFVVNSDDGITGVVTARDLTGPRVSLAMQKAGSAQPGDVAVGEIMTPRENMQAMTLHDVMYADVGRILVTLKHVGRQHALVTETDSATGAEFVRGIFSATNIGRRLGVPVGAFEVASTFAEIEAALAGT